MLFRAFAPSFLYVEASGTTTSQPKACSWPTEMMSNYFNFQYEVINVLIGSKVNERTLEVSFRNRSLFSKKVLGLFDLSAIDLVASSVISDVISSTSNLLTSTVLVLLVTASVVESNVEWFAILFNDRPVVRDYKEMLDIETQIFDVAYFRSKQINLLRPVEWNMLTEIKKVIKKYQEIWLLDIGVEPKGNISMADVLFDLLSMNAVMKSFIAAGTIWELDSYNWCMWSTNRDKCDKNNSILKFNQSAIEQLDKDYEEVRAFSACNPYSNFFKNSIGRAVDNGKDSVKVSVQDVKDSMNRLGNALIGKNGTWNLVKDPCDGISDYEMAQLRAYRWPNWTCWEWINLSSAISGVSSFLLKAKEYIRERKAQREVKEKQKEKKKNGKIEGFINDIQSKTTSEKVSEWYKNYWSGTRYSPEFSVTLYSDFKDVYEETMVKYWQSLDNANNSNPSGLLPSKGKWILDQMDTIMESNGKLEEVLQKIVDKQCSS